MRSEIFIPSNVSSLEDATKARKDAELKYWGQTYD